MLSDPRDYAEFLAAWTAGQGDVGQALRSRLALKAFEATATYDEAISGYFREQYASADLPEEKLVGPVQRTALRYGANPHQKPAQAFVTNGELPFKGTLLNASIMHYKLISCSSSSRRVARVHQSIGRPQLIRSCGRAASSAKSPGSCFIQARFTCRRCRRP